METTIKKWGNSLALRIPKALAKEAGLCYELPVELSLVEGEWPPAEFTITANYESFARISRAELKARAALMSGRRVHHLQAYSNCNVNLKHYPSYGAVLAQQGMYTAYVGKVDVTYNYVIPEPLTMGLLALGALLVRRR